MRLEPKEKAQQLISQARELGKGFTAGSPIGEFSLKCAEANARQVLIGTESSEKYSYWSKVLEEIQIHKQFLFGL